MKQLLLLSILASFTVAGTINQFTATSNGSNLTMHIVGTDDSGNAIDAMFYPGDMASVPYCGCKSQDNIKVIEGWDGTAKVSINGVAFAGKNPPMMGGNEGGRTDIQGTLPSIVVPDGAHQIVEFPIFWSLDIFLYTQGDDGWPKKVFELGGSGNGTATADLMNIGGMYSGDRFSYSSVASVPETSTSWLLLGGLGCLTAVYFSKRGQRG